MAAGARYFCTAGRGLEPFLAREVRARLGATEVDYVLGKVFFTTAAEPGELKELKSGERLFLLLKKRVPLSVSRNKGKMLHEIKSLLTEEPKSCLDVIATWRKLRSREGKKDEVSQESPKPHKRKPEEEINIASKRQKMEQVRETVSEECQAGAGENCVVSEEESDQDCQTESKTSLEGPPKSSTEQPESEKQNFSFRVSCRCSGAIAKILTSQEIGRAVGIALRKQFGWQADLRAPDLEIFLHLNDIHSVVGIPLFRLPLANREYIRTAGLRSTVAWAMASLAEISVGAFVLDPMCGLGTILLEAAKEWPEACYWGTDTSDSQLEGASVNIKTAGLDDKIELFKASVKALPLPSESFDAVISDIPFGKKFKITKDIQLLPDILQEMERVLRVGGIIVLLLNQDLRKRMDGSAKTAENESLHAISDGAGETTAVKALNNDGNSSTSGTGVEEPVLSCGQMCFGSLVPDGIYEVSLGKTDAFIYKYRKISTAGN
ncbi:THUMP domain-containing protein 2 isoform X2 [Tympanuchus pallidicinctus]|uniref:THUMP domain-containing protein 2 isoform X2 n=2 Tax=Tympanuchus pallidicinctus TaxID=109042 RepID=UPI0022872E1D|nr:THUMP domain-containing protein 2 isoform X2 [Tympanuchus pallidicinctus]